LPPYFAKAANASFLPPPAREVFVRWACANASRVTLAYVVQASAAGPGGGRRLGFVYPRGFSAYAPGCHHFATVNGRVKCFELLSQRQLWLSSRAQKYATFNHFYTNRLSTSKTSRFGNGRGDAHRKAISPLLDRLFNGNCCCHLDTSLQC
jgi:hypothetical protein